ncbi:MAG: family 20 glycosylhydrolase [Mycoplasmatales bacterium]
MNFFTEIEKYYSFKPIKFELIKNEEFNKIEDNCLYYTKNCYALKLLTEYNFLEKEYELNSNVKEIGMMLDCSRGRVYNLEYIKDLIRKNALSGYSYLMLYLEDLITIDIPNFGIMRGRYSDQEISEIVEYAKIFDIDVIPCIQTLGHMEQFLKYSSASKYKDTKNVLLAESEDTKILLTTLIKKCQTLFNTNRINVGLDETNDLGFGNYIAKNGYKKQADIFLEHLNLVNNICLEHGFTNVNVWSDMFFSIFSNPGIEALYDTSNLDIEYVKKLIPDNVSIVFWDYWSMNTEYYKDLYNVHQQLDDTFKIALGLHCWGTPVYVSQNIKATKDALFHINEFKIDDILYTIWNDDNSFVNFETVYLGMYRSVNLIHNIADNKDVFNFIYQEDYTSQEIQSALTQQPFSLAAILWEDPILQLYFKSLLSKENYDFSTIEKELIELKIKVDSINKISASTSCVQITKAISNLLYEKASFNLKILQAKPDQSDIEKINHIIELIKEYETIFFKDWKEKSKYHGIERLQHRFAGQIRRYEEIIFRINNNEPFDELYEFFETETSLPTSFEALSFSNVIRW